MYKPMAFTLGIIITLMITLNGLLATYIGNFYATVVINTIGLIAVSIVKIIRKEPFRFKTDLPLYFYLVGVLGVSIVFLNNFSFKNLGATTTVALLLLGQLVASQLVDHFGLFGMDKHPFHKQKLIGFIVIIAGILLIVGV